MEPSGVILATSIRWARGLHERSRGLRAGPPLRTGEVLILSPARQIHTFGVRYGIDVVFCDRDWRVRHIVRNMRPRRITRLVLSGHHAVEMTGGSLPGHVSVGDRLRVLPED